MKHFIRLSLTAIGAVALSFTALMFVLSIGAMK